MSHKDTLAQVAQLLETIHAEEQMKVNIELNSYFTKVEAKRAKRPKQITEILLTFGTLYPATILDVLEAYISHLEAQQLSQFSENESWNPENPPHWSHQRLEKRKRRRQDRALYRTK